MVDFVTKRPKNIDLVVHIPRAPLTAARRRQFSQLSSAYNVVLDTSELALVEALPAFDEAPVGDVLMALEAKACMTAHARARPRLFDELSSAWQCIQGAAQQAIAIGLGMVNAAPEFISPKRNKHNLEDTAPVVNTEDQPRQAILTQDKIKQIPVRGGVNDHGFDAVGIVTVLARNDSSPISLAEVPPSLGQEDPYNYERMILRVSGIYSSRFSSI